LNDSSASSNSSPVSGLLDLLNSVRKNKELPDVADWIEINFYIPEPRDPVTGEILPQGPIRLAELQKRILREALRRDEDGNFVYATILYSAPKKSGKTALASAVVLYLAIVVFEMDFIYLLANDGKVKVQKIECFGPLRHVLT